jgi:hypothetical protein
MAIIGGYAARNRKNVTAIQTKANQMGEGTANIAYEMGRLHIALLEQFMGGPAQIYYEHGYNAEKAININCRGKSEERRKK